MDEIPRNDMDYNAAIQGYKDRIAAYKKHINDIKKNAEKLKETWGNFKKTNLLANGIGLFAVCFLHHNTLNTPTWYAVPLYASFLASVCFLGMFLKGRYAQTKLTSTQRDALTRCTQPLEFDSSLTDMMKAQNIHDTLAGARHSSGNICGAASFPILEKREHDTEQIQQANQNALKYIKENIALTEHVITVFTTELPPLSKATFPERDISFLHTALSSVETTLTRAQTIEQKRKHIQRASQPTRPGS